MILHIQNTATSSAFRSLAENSLTQLSLGRAVNELDVLESNLRRSLESIGETGLDMASDS